MNAFTIPTYTNDVIIMHSNIADEEESVLGTGPQTLSSSKRQRHSIAGQMSYMKMTGFYSVNKKITASTNSLFSTAVISGSSSAPNLRDMMPVSSSGK